MATSIVFVDERVEELGTLLSGIDPDVQVVLIDAEEDGVAQIAAALGGESNLSAIHIVSHGSSGQLQLGATTLSEANLGQYADELGAIGKALSDSGDLLLYGCNVASGNAGLGFVQSLSAATNADIAASTDLTGAAALGGDWELEATTGTIEAQLALQAEAQAIYSEVLAPPILTSAGNLDTTFDGDGKVITAIGTGDDVSQAVAMQPDGKIVVVGGSRVGSFDDIAVVRYNANGSLDTSFSADGKVTTAIGTTTDTAYALALQPDGNIVVAGDSFSGVANTALARYSQAGELDISFTGDGKLVIPVGAATDRAHSVALQHDGRIVVAGAVFDADLGKFDLALLRLNRNGSLDTTFSQDGIVIVPSASGGGAGNAVALQSDGKILVAGTLGLGGSNDFALFRFNMDGSLDTSFDGDGVVRTNITATSIDNGEDLAIQPDGKILVAGSSAQDFALVRYNPDGSLDTTFSSDGKVTTSIGASFDVGRSLALQPDGKILVAGFTLNGENHDLAVVRYDSIGNLDASFDGDGKLTLALGSSNDSGFDLALRQDGGIVVAADSFNGSNLDFAVVRILGGGLADQLVRQDTAFGLTVPVNLFTDSDGSPLSYSATLESGSPLPGWLSFNPSTRTFSGTPTAADVGAISVKVNAFDGSSTASDIFVLTVKSNVIQGTSAADTLIGTFYDDNLVGAGGGDFLSGGLGNDTLNGGGGIDTLVGGPGNDIYVVNSATELGNENPDEGTDLAKSSVTYTLGSNVEKLALTGTSAINGNGNALNNVVTGNAAANTLAGRDGADTLKGGDGADLLKGEAGNDKLLGGAGNDKLNGGAGNDTLTGEAGADKFLFNATLGSTNVDKVSDFDDAQDVLQLENAIFTAIGAVGAFSASDERFHAGAGAIAAAEADDRIVHNTTTGALYYDADGAGGAAAIRFGTLTNLAALEANDIVVV